MTKTQTGAVLAAALTLSMFAAPVSFAEEGKTSTGGTESNSGSSGDKSDKHTQENAASADKNKQHR